MTQPFISLLAYIRQAAARLFFLEVYKVVLLALVILSLGQRVGTHIRKCIDVVLFIKIFLIFLATISYSLIDNALPNI